MADPQKRPHLSIVATTRNDNHGEKLFFRMQHFVSGFIEQCKRHHLNAELVLVEWNPPEETPPLSKALKFPQDKGPCSVRIVRVPKEVHQTLKHSKNLPLFQMIGKNVGIRRAKAKFVLATNIDILFSDPLIKHLKTNLKEGFLYRVDRIDVDSNLPPPETPFAQILSFCSKNIIRINTTHGPVENLKLKQKPTALITTVKSLLHVRTLCAYYDFKKFIGCTHPLPVDRFGLHTNGCGDFTLLSAEDWNSLRGYPEWNYYSWNLDGLLLHQANQHGIPFKCLPRSKSIYHIEHGAGFSQEDAARLFRNLEAKGIEYFTNSEFDKLVDNLQKPQDKVTFNDANWGMNHLSFEEIVI